MQSEGQFDTVSPSSQTPFPQEGVIEEVGLTVGVVVGLTVGAVVGLTVGVVVGLTVGAVVGLTVGAVVGASVVTDPSYKLPYRFK